MLISPRNGVRPSVVERYLSVMVILLGALAIEPNAVSLYTGVSTSLGLFRAEQVNRIHSL